VFEDASVETVVVLLTPESTESERVKNKINISNAVSIETLYTLPQEDYYGDDSIFFILSEKAYEIREKIESQSVDLGNISEIDFGLKTAAIRDI
jgi:hypothetical protein